VLQIVTKKNVVEVAPNIWVGELSELNPESFNVPATFVTKLGNSEMFYIARIDDKGDERVYVYQQKGSELELHVLPD
jgi:hypothetical protein